MEKEIQLEAVVTRADLYRFLLYHNYGKFMGAVEIIFSIGCLIGAILSWGQVRITSIVLLLLLGGMFTVYQPAALYWKAKRQARQPFFQKPVRYTFGEEGIMVTQGEESASIKWEELWKIVGRPSAIYVFITPVRANIIPRQSAGEKAEQILELARKKLETIQVKGK